MAPYHLTNKFFDNFPLPANQKLAIVVPLQRRGPGGSHTPIQKLAIAAPYGGRGEGRLRASRPRTPQLGSFAWADASFPMVGGGSAAKGELWSKGCVERLAHEAMGLSCTLAS